MATREIHGDLSRLVDMFTKNSKDGTQVALPREPGPPSLLSSSLKVSGDLHTNGEIQIDGHVIGDITANVLIVGETADVNGEIIADTLRVHGKVTGQIRAKSVSLAKTAHVKGDILHENLSIEQGAFLEGHCRRLEENGKKESSSPINLLVSSGSKSKSTPPPKKPQAEVTA